MARAVSLDAAWEQVSAAAAVHSFAVDVDAGRRQASVPARSAIEATFRDDDGPGSPARRDVLLLAIAAVEWTPAWMNRAQRSDGEIDLAVQAAANRSTNADAAYRQADLGPFLFFRWRF